MGRRRSYPFSETKGYVLLQKNIRMGRNGELDAVMQHDETLIFVEVKTRKMNILEGLFLR